MSRTTIAVTVVAALATLAFGTTRRAGTRPGVLPGAQLDTPAGMASGGAVTAVFAGGCFWGIEAVFEHVKGVIDVVSGYAGGTEETARYPIVSSGETGHAESVRVTFDPTKVTYGKLLEVFFSVAHDPTQLNRQGPDTGPQYRSAIFYANEDQQKVARAYIEQLNRSGAFSRPIVTQVTALDRFYPAEAYHQDYMKHHPLEPYIVFNDRPKVEHLKQQFPDLYRDR